MKWIWLSILNYSFAGCKFDSLDQLERCASLFYDEAVQFCGTPDIMPPGTQVSMSDVVPREQIHSNRWDALENPRWKNMMDEAISTGWTSEHTRMLVMPTNLGSVMVYLGLLWLFLGINLALPMCCCCTRSRRRNPANLLLIVILTMTLTISGMIFVSLTGQKSLELEDGVNGIQCQMPRAIYSVGFVRTEDIGSAYGRFEGIVNLAQLIKSMATTASSTVRYISDFSTEEFLQSLAFVPYSPLIWTGYLLSKQNYDSWLWAPNGTRKEDTKLRHFLLGNEILVTLDAFNRSAPPFDILFNGLSYSKHITIPSMSGYDEMEKDFQNTVKAVTTSIQPIVNFDTKEFLTSSIWWYTKKGAIIASFLPIAGIFGGFTLFVFYMIRSDNAFRTRNVSSRRLWATRFMSFGYSVYGISVLVLAGTLFVLLIMFRGTCDIVKREFNTGVEIRKWLPSDQLSDEIIKECVLEKGNGSLLAGLGLSQYLETPFPIKIAEWPLPQSLYTLPGLDLPTSLSEDLPTQQIDLALTDFESLGYWKPSSIRPVIFWSGLQQNDVKIDCTNSKYRLTCDTLARLLKENPEIPPPFTDYSTIYGLESVSRELSRILSVSSCKAVTVCVAGDSQCPRGAVVIGPDTVGPPPNSIQHSTAWETIANTMPRTRIAKTLFNCFNNSSREAQNEWLHATYYATLKAIALQGARRTTSSVDERSFHDNCPIGHRCSPFQHLNFLDPNRNLDDTLVPYPVFQQNVIDDIKAANHIYKTKGELMKTIVESGDYYNSLHRETSGDLYSKPIQIYSVGSEP